MVLGHLLRAGANRGGGGGSGGGGGGIGLAKVLLLLPPPLACTLYYCSSIWKFAAPTPEGWRVVGAAEGAELVQFMVGGWALLLGVVVWEYFGRVQPEARPTAAPGGMKPSASVKVD